ncbi:Spermidine coumaroyl CoA acyltransferase [Spatholobus suberectus]|nr:Spermidine coumaroyl CoA acyltransferase [Spatholobus suberectus]
MAYKNTLIVENKEVIFIKPLKPTPTTILSLSSIDNDPEGNYHEQSLHVYRSANHNSPYSSKLDPAEVIKEALSKALIYYYPVAGKLVRHADGKLRINCNSEGVPFTEAICNCDLSSLHYLDGNNVEMAKHFAVDFPSEDEFGNQYPLLVKVTKFLCGGFTFAACGSHAVCDGIGSSQFFRAMAELASGKTEPSVKPVWERERLVGTFTSQPLQYPMENAYVAVSPFLPSTDLSHECSKVDRESITRLKMSLMKESDDEDCTKNKGFGTFEALAAYIWRSRTIALKLNYDGETMLVITVGVRPHLLDPLPSGYYGNAIVEAYVMLKVRELNERPLLEVVKLIRESIKAASSNDYIRNAIDTLETKPRKYNYDYDSGAITIMTDWRYLELLKKVDFGWKEPVNSIPVPCDLDEYEGLCMILPPSNLDPSMSGGARVYVSLPSAAMPKFREEMKALTSIRETNSMIPSKI